MVKITSPPHLGASTAGPVEQGTSVTLTATVAPAAATGTVEFLAGATVLGTGTVASGVATLAATNLPVGTSSVTAVYSGDAAYNGSTSAPVSVEVTPVAPRATTTSIVSVTPIDGEQFQNVTIVCEVTAATGLPNGTMTVLDGSAPVISVPVTAGVVPPITTNLFAAGTHELSCSFVGTAPYQNSVSGSITATYVNSGPSQIDEQTVTVTIPAGALTITSPYTPTSPLYLGIATLDPATSKYSASGWFEDIVINDTRAGQLGWTASVVSSAFDNGTSTFSGIHAGLTELVANQLPGNAMQATDVALTNRAPATDGLDVPKVFAGYAAGKSLGSVEIEGRFGIAEVPSSVTPGLYTATVTFTVA